MAVFNPGTGGTLKSTTLERVSLEASMNLQNSETTTSGSKIAVNFFTGDNTVSIQAALPFTTTFMNGQVALTPTDYVGVPFANGGGDLQATTLPGAVLELFQRLQNTEKAQTDAGNKVQITYDTEAGLATINAEIPVVYVVAADGSLSIVAESYLA